MRGGVHRVEGTLLRVRWLLGDGSAWHLWAQFGSAAMEVGSAPPGTPVYRLGVDERDGGCRIAGGGVAVSIEPAP